MSLVLEKVKMPIFGIILKYFETIIDTTNAIMDFLIVFLSGLTDEFLSWRTAFSTAFPIGWEDDSFLFRTCFIVHSL